LPTCLKSHLVLLRHITGLLRDWKIKPSVKTTVNTFDYTSLDNDSS